MPSSEGTDEENLFDEKKIEPVRAVRAPNSLGKAPVNSLEATVNSYPRAVNRPTSEGRVPVWSFCSVNSVRPVHAPISLRETHVGR